MNRNIWLIIIIVLLVIGLGLGGYFVFKAHQKKSNVVSPPPEPSAVASISISPSTSPTTSPATVSQVKIFLIAVGDAGKSGKKIGCDDSAVAVTREVTPTQAPLKAALEQLLAIKTRDYGQSGLVNALADSNLSLQSVSIANGVATIKLTGTLSVAGTCQAPEIKAQIEETALQFSTVKTTNIFINDVALDSLLSQKGD